jgi:phage pi2 protein 07
MKKAFSVVELIFVIVIVAILANSIKLLLPDHTLLNDTKYIELKIKEKQFDAINYDNTDFSNQSWRDYFYDSTCIDLDKNSLIDKEKSSKKAKKYILSSQTTITLNIPSTKICFDNSGAPYINNYQLNNFVKMPIELNISYKSEFKTIMIMPLSGGVIIKK